LDDICGFGREKEYLLNVMRYKREWKKQPLDVSKWDMNDFYKFPDDVESYANDKLYFDGIKAFFWIMVIISIISSFGK